MRIVAGKYRGKALLAPDGQGTRPTSDRARESLFNILNGGRYSDGRSPLPGARVLDAFAGTGALGLEALSRGASNVVFMEQARPALATLRANINALKVQPHCQVLAQDVLQAPTCSQGPVDLILMDPPYDKGLIGPALTALHQGNWIGPETLVVAEMDKKEQPDLPEAFDLLDDRKYGKAKLIFAQLAA